MYSIMLFFGAFLILVLTQNVSNEPIGSINEIRFIPAYDFRQYNAPIQPENKFFWNNVADFIQGSNYFPIQVNVPDTLTTIYQGMTNIATDIRQRIPFLNRWFNPNGNARPMNPSQKFYLLTNPQQMQPFYSQGTGVLRYPQYLKNSNPMMGYYGLMDNQNYLNNLMSNFPNMNEAVVNLNEDKYETSKFNNINKIDFNLKSDEINKTTDGRDKTKNYSLSNLSMNENKQSLLSGFYGVIDFNKLYNPKIFNTDVSTQTDLLKMNSEKSDKNANGPDQSKKLMNANKNIKHYSKPALTSSQTQSSFLNDNHQPNKLDVNQINNIFAEIYPDDFFLRNSQPIPFESLWFDINYSKIKTNKNPTFNKIESKDIIAQNHGLNPSKFPPPVFINTDNIKVEKVLNLDQFSNSSSNNSSSRDDFDSKENELRNHEGMNPGVDLSGSISSRNGIKIFSFFNPSPVASPNKPSLPSSEPDLSLAQLESSSPQSIASSASNSSPHLSKPNHESSLPQSVTNGSDLPISSEKPEDIISTSFLTTTEKVPANDRDLWRYLMALQVQDEILRTQQKEILRRDHEAMDQYWRVQNGYVLPGGYGIYPFT